MTVSSNLNTLEASGLIRLAQVQPELEYIFRHTLVQEAAYTSLLRQERRRLHKAVGETLERLHEDRLDELAGTLAHHFAQAGEHDKGVLYARKAAQRAVTMYAYDEAIQNLRMAHDLLPADNASETRLQVLEATADVYRLMREGRRAIQLYQDALDVWESLPGADRSIAARLHCKIILAVTELKWAVALSEYQAAIEATLASRSSLEAALRLLESEPPHAETARLLAVLSIAAWRIESPSNWAAALRYAEAAVEMAQQLKNHLELSVALEALGTVYLAQGLLREFVQVALRRLETTQDPEFTDLREKLDSLRGAGNALMFVSEYEQAIPYLEEAESLANSILAVDQHFNAIALLTQCWFRLDRWDEALQAEEKGRELQRKYSPERTGPICYPRALTAVIHALRGDMERARAAQVESYEMMVMVAGPSEKWPLRNQHI